MNSTTKSGNGIWKAATLALTGVVMTLVGAYATSYAGFFHDAAPREELRAVEATQAKQGERISRMEGNIEGRLYAIEQWLRQLVQQRGSGGPMP